LGTRAKPLPRKGDLKTPRSPCHTVHIDDHVVRFLDMVRPGFNPHRFAPYWHIEIDGRPTITKNEGAPSYAEYFTMGGKRYHVWLTEAGYLRIQLGGQTIRVIRAVPR